MMRRNQTYRYVCALKRVCMYEQQQRHIDTAIIIITIIIIIIIIVVVVFKRLTLL